MGEQRDGENREMGGNGRNEKIWERKRSRGAVKGGVRAVNRDN